MGTGKSYSVIDDDWIIITFRFFFSWQRQYLGKIEKKKLKLTSPHVTEPNYCLIINLVSDVHECTQCYTLVQYHTVRGPITLCSGRRGRGFPGLNMLHLERNYELLRWPLRDLVPGQKKNETTTHWGTDACSLKHVRACSLASMLSQFFLARVVYL